MSQQAAGRRIWRSLASSARAKNSSSSSGRARSAASSRPAARARSAGRATRGGLLRSGGGLLRSRGGPGAGRMASDEDYMAFLDKANRERDEGQAAAARQSKGDGDGDGDGGWGCRAVDDGGEVPKAIREVCEREVYVSDADEPFEGVSLRWEGGGGLPDEVDFAKLIHRPDAAGADVAVMDPADWDPRGRYGAVVGAVREAGRGADVRVYRVARGGTRAEYWVVAADRGRVMGVRALGVES